MSTLRKFFNLFSLALTSSASIWSSIVLMFAGVTFPLRRIFKLPAKTFTVYFKLRGKIFPVFLTDGSDIAVLIEVFKKEEYVTNLNFEPKTILDLGANVGYASLYLGVHYPNTTIYSLEALPETFTKLERNVSHWPNVIPLNLAANNVDGPVAFYAHAGSSMSSSLMARAKNDQPILVTGTTLDSFMLKHHLEEIGLIKFDIEGGEYEVFKNFTGLKTCRAIIGEFHEDLSGRSLAEFLALFQGWDLKTTMVSPKRFLVSGVNS